MSMTYRDAGVDIDVGDEFVRAIAPLVKTTRRPEVVGSLGGFSGLFALGSNRYADPLLVASTDGVGTKLKVANLLGRHETVGIDLVAMCVNDIVVTGAEPLFFLDYFAIGRLDPDQGRRVILGIAEGCRQAGCALLGGETAEMPGFYPPGEYDLAGFCVGAVERSDMLGPHRVEEGDVLIGMASDGLHANGFSLVRRVLVEKEDADLTARLEGLSVSLGEELLRPTRIYAKPVLDMIRTTRVHALAHITGGGLPGNLPRILPEHLAARVQAGSWPIPAIFGIVREAAEIDDHEMMRTFNLGVGMVAAVPEASVTAALEVAAAQDVPCFRIGRLTKRQGDENRFQLLPAPSG